MPIKLYIIPEASGPAIIHVVLGCLQGARKPGAADAEVTKIFGSKHCMFIFF